MVGLVFFESPPRGQFNDCSLLAPLQTLRPQAEQRQPPIFTEDRIQIGIHNPHVTSESNRCKT